MLRYSKTCNTKVTRVPKYFLSLYVSSQPNADPTIVGSSYDRLFKSCSIGSYFRRINHYSEIAEDNYEYLLSPYHYCERLIDIFSKNRSIWVLCDGVSRTLTLLNLWKYFDNSIIEIPGYIKQHGEIVQHNKNSKGYIGIGGDTEMIKCKSKDCNVTIVSISNYGNITLADIAEQFNNYELAERIKLGEDHEDYPSAMLIQRAMARWYRNLMEYWRNNDCGTWKETASQLSHSLYKRQFMKEVKYEDRNPMTDRLERSAVFGGRTAIWYAGDCLDNNFTVGDRPSWYHWSKSIRHTGQIYRIDISSMYPYIFCEYATPGKLVFHDIKGGTAHLKSTVDSGHIVVASVRMTTDIPEYPTRIGGGMRRVLTRTDEKLIYESKYFPARVLYPTGTFDTVLVGPELDAAIAEGSIDHCYEYALYHESTEYSDYFRYLLNKRYECKVSGDKFQSKLWKLISNSFGGKLAQRNCGWKNCEEWPSGLVPWGMSYSVNADTGESNKYRCISQYPQKWHEDEYSASGSPIVWAYVCSVGRYIMRSIRELLPPGSVIQQDTDGMYVTGDAIEVLRRHDLIDDIQAGSIRIVSKHKHLRCYGPRHYVCDYIPVMSGLSYGFKPQDNNSYIDTKQTAVIFRGDNEPPNSIHATTKLIPLDVHNTGYIIHDDLSVTPERISGEFLWKDYGSDPLASLFRGLA